MTTKSKELIIVTFCLACVKASPDELQPCVVHAGECSEIVESELENPVRLQALLNEVLLYEQHLLTEKNKLSQRLAAICSVLNKSQ